MGEAKGHRLGSGAGEGAEVEGCSYAGRNEAVLSQGDLASHVLGYVGLDGKGLASIEYKLNSVLQGNPGRVLLASDSAPVSLPSQEWRAWPGKGVSLTLDESIQYIAEKAIDEVVNRTQAAGATVIVQDPHTGEILAMASRPSFNSNRYQKVPQENWINRAVAWAFEPGSTFKLITLAASLEEDLTTPEELIDCENGSLVVAGHRIRDHRSFGVMTTTEVLANSSNVGAMKLAQRVGEKDFYKYIERFGFGRPTGIALPGESRGLVRPRINGREFRSPRCRWGRKSALPRSSWWRHFLPSPMTASLCGLALCGDC